MNAIRSILFTVIVSLLFSSLFALESGELSNSSFENTAMVNKADSTNDKALLTDDFNWSTIEDAAGMFNERGYLKSNSFSFDGNEVVNNYNGNLIYTQQLWHEPVIQNDLALDFKLTYNGSVGHTINNGVKYKVPEDDKHFSFNHPEWIISVNNIAIQTFNFANEQITWADSTSGYLAEASAVSTLINGYHSCYSRATTYNGEKYATISILMGDGSLSQYIAEYTQEQIMGRVYTGNYYSMSKDDQSRGYLNASDSIFTLFQPNGTTVNFKLYRPFWNTNLYGNDKPDQVDSLIMLLPTNIYRPGSSGGINIEYATQIKVDQDSIYVYKDYPGHPLVLKISAPSQIFEFYWDVLDNLDGYGTAWLMIGKEFYIDGYFDIATETQVPGTYHFDMFYGIDFTQRFSQSNCNNLLDLFGSCNRGLVERVVDRLGRETEFNYGYCQRASTNFKNESEDYYEISLNNFKYIAHEFLLEVPRIKEIVYPDGGKSEYRYVLGENPGVFYDDSIVVDFQPESPPNPAPSPLIKSSTFNSLGRDPYFQNIVRANERKLANGQTVSVDSMIYSWRDVYDGSANNLQYTITPTDSFFTTRVVYDDSGITTDSKKFDYIYKNFQENGPFSNSERDRGLSLKLMQTVQSGGPLLSKSSTNSITVNNRYYTDDATFYPTLLPKTKTTIKEGITTIDSFAYEWHGDIPPTSSDFLLVNNLSEKSSYDAWGLCNTSYYDTSFTQIIDGADEFLYYNPSLVDSQITSLGSNLLEKHSSTYCAENNDSSIIGKIQSSERYIIEEGIIIDTLRSNYCYDNIYGVSKVVSPLGDSTTYEYGSIVPVHRLYDDDSIITNMETFLHHNSYWTKKLSYISNSDNGWDTIFAINTTSAPKLVVGAQVSAPTGWGYDADSVIIPIDQIIKYKLKMPPPGNDCPTGGVARIYIDNEPLYEWNCDSSGSEFSGTEPVDSGQEVKVTVTAPSIKSAVNVQAYFNYIEHADSTIDTVGIRDLDAISRYRSINTYGINYRNASANGFFSSAACDKLGRIKNIVLPGGYRHPDSIVADTNITLEVAQVADTSFMSFMSEAYEAYCDGGNIILAEPDIRCNDEDAFRIYSNIEFMPFGDKDTKNPPCNREDLQSIIMASDTPFGTEVYSYIVFDSAFLNIYCSEIFSGSGYINIENMPKRQYSCSEEKLYWSNTEEPHQNLSEGWNRIPIMTPHSAISMKLEPFHSGGDLSVYSNNHSDSTYWPTIEVYFTGVDSSATYSHVDSVYSINYQYEDFDLDDVPSSVTQRIRKQYGQATNTNRVRFDGLGRTYRSDVFDSGMVSSDSSLVEFDFADRAIMVTDQLGYETDSDFDVLDRPVQTSFPDSSNSNTSVSYGNIAPSNAHLYIDTMGMGHYGLFTSTFTDENENQIVEYTDILGNKRLIRRFNNNSTDTLNTYFMYDDYSNMTEVIKPMGDTVHYRYNNLGWLTKEWAADYDTIFYCYDKNGQLINTSDGRSRSHKQLIDSSFVESFFNASGDVDTVSVPISVDGRVYYTLGVEDCMNSLTLARIQINDSIVDYAHTIADMTKSGATAVLANDTVYVITQVNSGDASTAHSWGSASYYNTDEVFSVYTTYDAIGRVTKSGKLYGTRDLSNDQYVLTDTTEIVPKNHFIYDNEYCKNSIGRLAIAYSNDNGYSYGEEYNYDARGRIESQINHFEPQLDSTIYDSAYVEREKLGGLDSIVFVIQKTQDVEYTLKIDPSVDVDSYVSILKNDSLVDSISIETVCPECIRITKIDTLACEIGDTLTMFVNIDGTGSDVTFAYLYASARYQYYNRNQYMLVDGDEYEIGHSYNQADQVTSITYPDGMVVTYTYDDRGRLQYVGDTLDIDRYASYTYTDRAEVEQMLLGPDMWSSGTALQTVDYTYNARGWLNSINNGSSSSEAPNDLFGQRLYYYGKSGTNPAWDSFANGNISGQEYSMQDSDYSYRYEYDDLDQITLSYYNVPFPRNYDEYFHYDLNGNIVGRKFGGDSLTINYESGTNKIDSYKRGAQIFSPTYDIQHDANGNLVYDSSKKMTFIYDTYNQLSEAITSTEPGTSQGEWLQFGYSTGGQRIYKNFQYSYMGDCTDSLSDSVISKLGGSPNEAVERIGRLGFDNEADKDGDQCLLWTSSKTRYIRDKISDKVLAEYTGNSMTLENKYIYAGSNRIAMYDKDGNLYFYLTDHLGSSRVVVDTTGTVRDKYNFYYAFGDEAGQTLGLNQKYRYTSKPYDNEGDFDLYYYGARYYDPVFGRFMSKDAMRSKLPAWSPYAYCTNNPINCIDPDGNFGLAILAGIIAGILLAPDIANAPAPGEPTYYISPKDKIRQTAGAVAVGVTGAYIIREVVYTAAEATGSAALGGDPTPTQDPSQSGTQSSGRAETPAPDKNASGDHSTLKQNQAGETTNAATYTKNEQNPSGWDQTSRTDLQGSPHTDKATGQNVETPHVHKKVDGKNVVVPLDPTIPD